MWERHKQVYRRLEPRLFKVIHESVLLQFLGGFEDENSAWEGVIELVHYSVNVLLWLLLHVSGCSFMTGNLHVDLHVVEEIVGLGVVEVVVGVLECDCKQQHFHRLKKVHLNLLHILVKLEIELVSSQGIWEENRCVNTEMNNYGQNKMDMLVHRRVTLNNDRAIFRFQRVEPHYPIFESGQNHYRSLEPALLSLLLNRPGQHFPSIFGLILLQLFLVILIGRRA